MQSSGILLTRQSYDNQGKLEIALWLKNTNKSVQLLIKDEKAVFFIEQTQLSKALEALKSNQIPIAYSKALSLKTFLQQSTAALYFSSLRHFYAARDCLKQMNIKCYEDDIRPEDRYLMERFITQGIQYAGVEIDQKNYLKVNQVKCKAAKLAVNLLMVSIDIECSFQGDLYSIAAYGEEIAIVFMIGEKQTHQLPIEMVWCEDEKALLRAFIDWFLQLNPDVIIGWNVVNFDFKLLQKRCDIHGIDLTLGKNLSKVRWRQNKNTEQSYIEIAGRVVLDGIDLLKTATYSFASFSLDFVSHELLGIGKKVDDVDNRVKEITDNFHHHKLKLAEYNLEDCRLVWLIFEKTQLLQFALLRAHLTGLSIDRVGGSVAAFTHLYLPKLHRGGYVAPNLGDGSNESASPGGYVMDSKPGFYRNVLVLDFKSLYPSIIRTFCIDPMGMVEGELDKNSAIPAYDGAYFSRERHFLPTIIAQLWQERDKAKRENNSALSQAIKIIMNSFYGILGSNGCRFFDYRLAGAITKRGHEILKQTTQWLAEKHQDYSVIYGDTDSLFVHINEQLSEQECLAVGQQLERELNHQWQQYLQQEFGLTSYLEIEFEQHYLQFLMPTIRGLEVGSKKRYAGLVSKNGEQKLIFKGLESVRTDWTELAKQFQRTLYWKVFNGEAVEHYIIQLVTEIKSGRYDEQLIYRKRLRRKLALYVKNVPPHVKAARLADEQNKKLNKPLKYQNKGWISYVITLAGPQPIEYISAALDYDFYIERQLEAVADGILPFIGLRFSTIIDKQLDLF